MRSSLVVRAGIISTPDDAGAASDPLRIPRSSPASPTLVTVRHCALPPRQRERTRGTLVYLPGSSKRVGLAYRKPLIPSDAFVPLFVPLPPLEPAALTEQRKTVFRLMFARVNCAFMKRSEIR